MSQCATCGSTAISDRSLGDEHVRPEIAEAARAAAAPHEIEKLVAETALLEAGNVVVAELRFAR